MRLRQASTATRVTLVITAVVVIIGLTGITLLSNNTDRQTDSGANAPDVNTEENSSNEAGEIPYAISEKFSVSRQEVSSRSALHSDEILELEEMVVLDSLEDLEKLPQATPDSFEAYMRAELESNSFNENNCVQQYNVHTIHRKNIKGGVGVTDTVENRGNDCTGIGSGVIWSYADSQWHESGTQGAPKCETIRQKRIYSEFAPVCYRSSPSGSGSETVENPVGSIEQIPDS